MNTVPPRNVLVKKRQYFDFTEEETAAHLAAGTLAHRKGEQRWIPDYEGICHGFFQEGDSGELCVVGLVERPDGSLETPYAASIQFLTPTVLP